MTTDEIRTAVTHLKVDLAKTKKFIKRLEAGLGRCGADEGGARCTQRADGGASMCTRHYQLSKKQAVRQFR